MHTNRLAREKSPYLLQHAHNPVDWYPWGEEAFAKARRENKPIFLSVGYSTCHWCHVMERESFEDERIAEILNRAFVPVKVDREERPDVDRIYMTFVQATTGSGGWPMSVWLTPELQPFLGGTYFPPETRYGHPGFGTLLERLENAWQSDRAQIEASARDVVRQLEQQVQVTGSGTVVDAHVSDSAFFAFRRGFDASHGGFGGAPKFPRPSVFDFLLRYWARTKNQEALDMTLTTLQAMALGGMNDQLGGGFHRYSVDERWFVPHFEKMLYDQAQLVVSYLEAFQITGDPAYADVARATLDYVLREMTSPAGGFYSAEDADSATDPANPKEKGEGAFYIWTRDEIAQAAGEAVEWFCYRYGVRDGGNVDHDPHGEFTGRNILEQAHTVEDTAAHFSRSPEEVAQALDAVERRLLAARAVRPRPHLDDKILTAWNGLMISAFARAGAILDAPVYARAARRAADFVASRLYDSDRGVLLRRYRDGEAAIDGFLDDYAFFVQGLLDLYEAQFDARDVEFALRLTEKQRELFEDAAGGGFYSSGAADRSLVLRVKEDYDGAEPSGNSVAALNLLRLARMTGSDSLQEAARRTLQAFSSRVAAQPVAAPQMMAAFEFAAAAPRQTVIAGTRGADDTQALARAVHTRFLPFQVSLLADGSDWQAPAVRGMAPVDGRAAAYVCRDYACQLPVTDAARLGELIQ
jgi:uncharacterized protein